MRFFIRPADGRQYSIFPPKRDLLGDVVVVTVHSSNNSRRGGIKTYFAGDPESAAKLEASIAKIRLRHGYIELF